MAISHVNNPSSSMSPQPDYQVFLSFRGPDTRRNFADFLCTSLTDVGILVFWDDKELEIGQEMNAQLNQAIELSKISIPIISESYASSYSCLMELKQMVDCKDIGSHSIIPIFYYVNPSDARSCEGPFKTALEKHKESGIDDSILNSWKYALRKIAELVGKHLHEKQEKTHGEFIKLIVHKVEQMLRTRDLILPKQLVPVDPHVQEIIAKLKVVYRNGQPEIGEPREMVLGIYGIPGVGKTVLAKYVYNQLHHLFDACSFLEKIQEDISKNGILSVQNRLISHLHKGNAQKFDLQDHALNHIQERLAHMKVLLLLDDVKDCGQLSALVGELGWLHPGSRVILTSRSCDVLQKVNAAENYVLGSMKEDKALTLFCRHAFNTDSPPEDFERLATHIVAATDRLPLALEKIGGSLFGKRRKVWREKLNQLKDAPDEIVQEAFLKSYTTLDEKAQQIFLDIACFFNGMDERIPHYMWEHCEYYPYTSILSLRAKSLVEIGEDKELCMRGILKAFGREIVRSEKENEPCQRSRLWNHEEALDVLIERRGTEKVEALGLKFADRSDIIKFQRDEFDGLQNLRFLELDQANLQGDFQDHFSRLRWLGWQGAPLMVDIESLNLNLQNLVILDLSGSLVSQEWRGWRLLSTARQLKALNLTGCANLSSTPIFPDSFGLERLILEGCCNLAVTDSSICNLEKLVSLNLKGCSLLSKLPDLRPMRRLKELVIDGTSISRINVQEGSLRKLKFLSARNCEKLAEISDSIRHLKSLKYLSIEVPKVGTPPESIELLKEPRPSSPQSRHLSSDTATMKSPTSVEENLEERNVSPGITIPYNPSHRHRRRRRPWNIKRFLSGKSMSDIPSRPRRRWNFKRFLPSLAIRNQR